MSKKPENSVSGKAFDFGQFMRIMRYVKPYRPMFIYTSILVLLSAGLPRFDPGSSNTR